MGESLSQADWLPTEPVEKNNVDRSESFIFILFFRFWPQRMQIASQVYFNSKLKHLITIVFFFQAFQLLLLLLTIYVGEQ